jgi:hypothetical protein
MTSEQHDLIIKLREQVRALIAKYEHQKKEKQLLFDENSELKHKLSVKEKECESINKKYDTLKLAKVFTGEDGETHEAKVKVNKIVREIDKCIALLNK